MTVDAVSKTFGRSRSTRRRAGTTAVDGVSLAVARGESIGIVGESGSGKSTLANIVCGLRRPDEGTVTVDGVDVYARRAVDRSLWRSVQMVFQDPYTSLNPTMTIGQSVAEPLRLWHGMARKDAEARADELLAQVGMDPDASGGSPSTLSGGQRQRVSIARALAVSPKLIVFDESVSALDVSVQAQILELVRDLKKDIGLSYIFISHDIGVIRLVSDRVLVMHDGRVVEECAAEDLHHEDVRDPYTKKLLGAVPRLGAGARDSAQASSAEYTDAVGSCPKPSGGSGTAPLT